MPYFGISLGGVCDACKGKNEEQEIARRRFVEFSSSGAYGMVIVRGYICYGAFFNKIIFFEYFSFQCSFTMFPACPSFAIRQPDLCNLRDRRG